MAIKNCILLIILIIYNLLEMDKLNFATINANGLRARAKLNKVQKFFYKNNLDFIFLQETHYAAGLNNYWTQKWKGKAFWAGNSIKKAGVGIVFSENKNVLVTKTEIDPNGRYLVINCKIESEELTLICVYVPDVPTLRKRFMEKTFVPLLNNITIKGEIIMGGDFNCVEDVKFDRKDGTGTTYHVKAAKILSPYLKSKNLKDIWHKNNKNKNGGFTWYNHDKTIASRIDRIYLQPNLTKLVKDVRIERMPFSDHKAVIIEIPSLSNGKHGKGFWKMNTSVLKGLEFKSKIEGMWICWKDKKKDMKLDEWWDLGKTKIAALTQQHCKKLSKKKKFEINKLNKEIENERENLQPDLKIIGDLEAKLELIGDKDSYGTQIRSKQKLAEDLEVPSEFFYLQEKSRIAGKTITEMHINGKITENQEQIAKHVKQFYNNLYKPKKINKKMAEEILNYTSAKCDENSKKILEKEITNKELKNALMETEKNKSPGMDGLPYEFYKEFWEIIGDDLTEVINQSQKNGKLSLSQRRAVITLIPKGKKDKTKVENWRPISLQNCDIKIFTKAITKRLEKVMPNIIKPSQTCSIKGRQLYHHTLLIREIISQAKIDKKPVYIISFDQEKAFDQVNWEYLEMVLKKFDFPETFISLIKTLYNEIESTVLINGNLTSFFKVLRGLRQGCPLSLLLLYILISETLGNYIESGKIEGYKMPVTGEMVKHLQYADDTSAILNNLTEIETILEMFRFYCKATGAVLNETKTKGIYINHPDDVQLKCSIPVDWNKNDTKILGIIFTPDQKMNRKLNWDKVLEKMEKRSEIMKTRNLSLRGKVIIINTIILSKAWHVGRIYLPTLDIIRKINRIIFNYIWGKKHEPVAREALFQDLKKGGLGVIEVLKQCAAMQIKEYFEIDKLKAPFWTQYAIYWNSKPIKQISNIWSKLPEYEKFRRNKPLHHKLLLEFLIKIDPTKIRSDLTVKEIRKTIKSDKQQNYPKDSTKTKVESDFNITIDWEKALKANFVTLGSPKYANIYFKLLHNAIPALTTVKRWYRDANMRTTCKVCGIEDETPTHIFLCSKWSDVWALILRYVKDITGRQLEVEEAIMAQHQINIKISNTFIFCAMDRIYQARNRIVFDNQNTQPEILKNNIINRIISDLTLRYQMLGNSFVKGLKQLADDTKGTLKLLL